MTARSLIDAHRPAGRHQFPADQPHPAPLADAVHGLAEPHRAALAVRGLSSPCGGCSPIWTERGRGEALQEPARLLHPRAEGGRAADRRRSRACSRVPAMRWSAPAGGSTRARCCRRRDFPIRSRICWRDAELVHYYRGGQFATLRLTSSMYHRFHAPYDCRVEQVNYISGDTWNVNPIALKRVERLFCKNERAVIRCRLPSGALLTLVPVAAILVASIRLEVSRRAAAPAVSGPEPHSRATRRCARARRWAGSSTARPSSCSRREGLELCARLARRRQDPHGRGADARCSRFRLTGASAKTPRRRR